MSNIGNLVNDLNSNNATGMQLAQDIFGTAADASSAVGAVTQILQMLNVIQSPDQQLMNMLSQIENKIDSDFRQLEGDIAAEGILAKQRDIDQGINSAAAVFQLLPTIVPELSTVGEAYILEQIQTCVAAIQFFTDYPDKWEIPWASLPKDGAGTATNGYSDFWSGTLAPPESQFIFNYTYVLPQFLRAIYIALTTIVALKQAALAQPNIQAVFTKALTKLQQVHDSMQTGIWATKLPTAYDVANQGISQDIDQWQSAWFGGPRQAIMAYWEDPNLWPVGAVEIYSTLNNVASYVQFMPYELLPDSQPAVPDSFVNLVALRLENSKKMLYQALGLPAVRGVINRLLTLTGQPVPAAVPFETWSLRNAASILGLAPSAGSLSFFGSFKSFLSPTPPYHWGLTFPAASQGTYPASPIPKSFRLIFSPV